MKKEDIILREGNVIVRTTTINEEIVGSQHDIFSRALLSEDVIVDDVGSVNYLGEEINFGYASIQKVRMLFAEVPKIKMKLVFDQYGSPTFARNITAGRKEKTIYFEPAAVNKRAMFIATLDMTSSKGTGFAWSSCYMVFFDKNKMYRFVAPNHHADGRICMGQSMPETSKNMGGAFNDALKKYAEGRYNGDLRETRMDYFFKIDENGAIREANYLDYKARTGSNHGDEISLSFANSVIKEAAGRL